MAKRRGLAGVPGSDPIQLWAMRRGMAFFAEPDMAWFEQWEPFDTLIAASRYINALVGPLSSTGDPAHMTLVEPWTADDGMEPVDRTLLGFVTHPGLRVRASARFGEWFLTRVAFVGSAPPNRVVLGVQDWDDSAATFAVFPDDAQIGFHARLRELLCSWRFRGHLELRPGGLVVHVGGLRPVPKDLDRLADFLPRLVEAALAYPE